MPRLASPAMVSPATTPTVRGRKSGIETVSAVNETNSPFCVMSPMKAGPRPESPAEVTRTATAIRMGTSARAPSMAIVRRRRNSVASSDPRSANGRAPRVGVARADAFASPRDIEALPGQGDEALLEGLACDRDPAHAHAGCHQGGGDGLREHAVHESRASPSGRRETRALRDPGRRRPARGRGAAGQHAAGGRGIRSPNRHPLTRRAAARRACPARPGDPRSSRRRASRAARSR